MPPTRTEFEALAPADAGRLRAYLQLVRLPNVFTAMADVAMGIFVVRGESAGRGALLALVAASSLLYLAGMVLNDLFDREQDARERPERPIPSGRVSVRAAAWLGAELLLLGTGLGWLASSLTGDLRSGIVATLLAAAVVAYDRWLKRTPLGPLAMGLCRALNVLLGMSAASAAWQAPHALIAAGLGVYIAGVTWFARTEAATSRRAALAGAVVVMAAGLALVAAFPYYAAPAPLGEISGPQVFDRVEPGRWHVLWVALTLLICGRAAVAVAEPSPRNVQRAVKNAILSLIVFDTVVAFAVRDWGQPVAEWSGAMLLLLLLLPALFLGRWIYST